MTQIAVLAEIVLAVSDDLLDVLRDHPESHPAVRLRLQQPGWNDDADAVFVTFMQGLELGVEPDYWSSTVVRTGHGESDRLAVTGIAFPPDDRPAEASEELEKQVDAVLGAVQEFNSHNKISIRRLAIDLRGFKPLEMDSRDAIRTIDRIIRKSTFGEPSAGN